MLPDGFQWYKEHTNYWEHVTGLGMTKWLSDIEQAVYIKGGSIMPTLLHQNCTALTKCINDGIKLEVYLDDNKEASGSLYTDDGISFEHETNDDFAYTSFKYSNNTIKSSRSDAKGKYAYPETQVIQEIVVFGLDATKTPSAIT